VFVVVSGDPPLSVESGVALPEVPGVASGEPVPDVVPSELPAVPSGDPAVGLGAVEVWSDPTVVSESVLPPTVGLVSVVPPLVPVSVPDPPSDGAVVVPPDVSVPEDGSPARPPS
jgi:hypothetical protein